MNRNAASPPPSNDSPSDAAEGPSSRRGWIRFAKALVALMVAAGLFWAVRESVQQWRQEQSRVQRQVASLRRELSSTHSEEDRARLSHQIAAIEKTLPSLSSLRWSYVALGGLLYGFGLVPNAFLLRRALICLGQQPRRSTAIAAHLLGHVGKYVPGKAMVVVLRAGALRRDGVMILPATISIFLETFLMMAVGGALAGLIVLWLPVPGWISIAAVGVAVISSLPTLPPVLRLAAAKVGHRAELAHENRIDFRLFAAGWGWSLLTWLLIGASFTSLLMAIPFQAASPPLWQAYAVGTAAISLAIVIGFASLLPGGAGVRELVLTTILGVVFGSLHGLLAAIAARIVFLLVEAVLALLCWWWLGLRSVPETTS